MVIIILLMVLKPDVSIAEEALKTQENVEVGFKLLLEN